jgi:hypothetical protein
VLADNKLAEKAGWDRELLSIELQGVTKNFSRQDGAWLDRSLRMETQMLAFDQSGYMTRTYLKITGCCRSAIKVE